MSDKVRKVPLSATRTRPPIGGTLILVLLQREFAWAGWVSGVVWTLWAIVWIIAIVGIWQETDDDKNVIPDKTWREVFK